MPDILELDRLSKRYGDVTGVAEVTLGVADGAFVTLLGPSGCGKSTLLRMVGGFEAPSAGRVLLDGTDLTERPPHRRPVNMVFQDYALFPHLSVGKNVAYGLRVQRGRDRPTGADIRRRTSEALELVGLADKAQAAPHELSGGQRQRVALARALVRRPRVLLLDEPLSALDANLRDAMQVELRRLHDEVGLTFVMVTHDQSEALTLSDRVVVMRDGRIVQEGTPDELYESPANAWVAGFVGHTNLFESPLRHEGGEWRVRCHGQSLMLLDASVRGVAPGAQSGDVAPPRTFGFRPEGAELVEPDAATPNVLRGRVARTLYHGHGVRLLLDLDGGEIAVDLPMRDACGRTSLPARSELVGVAVPAHRIMVLDADDAGRAAA